MRQIGTFSTDDPRQLMTQLSNLEQNIVKETGDIRAGFVPDFAPTRIAVGGGIYSTGIALLADTSAGPFSVVLANPQNNVPGMMLVVNESGNHFTVVPTAPTLINLAASNFYAAGLFTLFFDGQNWWSP